MDIAEAREQLRNIIKNKSKIVSSIAENQKSKKSKLIRDVLEFMLGMTAMFITCSLWYSRSLELMFKETLQSGTSELLIKEMVHSDIGYKIFNILPKITGGCSIFNILEGPNIIINLLAYLEVKGVIEELKTKCGLKGKDQDVLSQLDFIIEKELKKQKESAPKEDDFLKKIDEKIKEIKNSPYRHCEEDLVGLSTIAEQYAELKSKLDVSLPVSESLIITDAMSKCFAEYERINVNIETRRNQQQQKLSDMQILESIRKTLKELNGEETTSSPIDLNGGYQLRSKE